ncbi:MAG: DUF2252 family protein [Bdellovibrionia bacterium]
MRAFVLSLLILFMAVPAHTGGDLCHWLVKGSPQIRATWRQVGARETLSQFIRANARHYWAWMRTNASKHVAEFLKYEGMVVGDMHMGNFSIVVINGRLHMKVADFDDGGRAPFVLDLARHIITTRSVNDSIKRWELTDAYQKGLRAEKMDPPEFIEEILETSKKKVQRWEDEYVDNNTKKDRIKIDHEDFQPLPARTQPQRERRDKIYEEIGRAVAPGKLIDLIKVMREEGGAAGVQRYRGLVRRNGRDMIVEFKHIAEPATSQWSLQKTPRERLKHLLELFWESLHTRDPHYGIVEIEGESFWMRPKPLSLIDIPYTSTKKSSQEFVRELSLYQAYLLGKLHGSQASGRRFLREIDKEPDAFYETVRTLAKDYQNLAEGVFKRGQEN